MNYNRFGAVFTDVLALFPGAVVADFGLGDDPDTDGQEKIEAQLDRTAREIAGAFTADVYRCLAEEAELEMVVKYATAGQTSCQLGLIPVVAGTVHLWRFGRDDDLGVEPVFGVNELTASVDVATGVVTGITPALSAGDKVFATYEVDCEDEDFAWPSVADVVAIGAAAAMGAQLYTQGSQEWALVDDLKERYRGRYVVQEGGTLSMARSGTWVPDELRTLRWWREIERATDKGTIGSIRKYRG